MATKRKQTLDLTGFEPMPSQVWGSIRIVPLTRKNFSGDLRLGVQRYQEAYQEVVLKGTIDEPKESYVSFVPHALIASWDSEGNGAVAHGTRLKKEGKTYGDWRRISHRMSRRTSPNELKFLPLHLAMEGYLGIHFGGPDVAWKEYSSRALSHGFSERSERSYLGQSIAGLQEALRIFEIHENQCGVLIFVADALATCFIVPHPEDYRKLHGTLLNDFYGELIMYYSQNYNQVNPFQGKIDESRIASLNDIRTELNRIRKDWADFYTFMAGNLFGPEHEFESLHKMGRFKLKRFTGSLHPDDENHIGEVIMGDEGMIEYMHSFRLSLFQIKRAYLLNSLAVANWNLDVAAVVMHTTKLQLINKLQSAGFGFLIKN